MRTLFELPPTAQAVFDAFCALQVKHPRQATALDEVWRSLGQARQARQHHPGGDGEITLLYGPTGVGKTTLWEHVKEQALLLHVRRDLPGRLPYLYTLADVPMAGTMQMKSFYVATLAAADEVLIQHKQLVRPLAAPQSSWQATTAGLRQATLSMLKHRQPIVFCIDEAHHLGIHSTEKQREKNLDAIKTFADAATAPILMIGSYELIEFASVSGRLGRRVREVHLSRYDIDDAQDQRDFRSVVHFFSKRLSCEKYDLNADRRYFHDRTVGCVGLLKQWFERALYRALAAGRLAVREQDIREAEPSRAVVNQWIAEINAGEARLRVLATANQPALKALTTRPNKPFERKQITDSVGAALS